MKRRSVIAGIAAVAAVKPATAQTIVGVTKTEIKVGNTSAYSGPASAYSIGAKTAAAYINMINDQGGIHGRKINLISLDDGYNPAKTVEVVRRLVEQEEVAIMFANLGTAPNSSVHKYVNLKKIPLIFLASGADKFADYKNYPWSLGWGPSYRTEGQIYAKYLNAQRPQGKIAMLYQNDDLGKDYLEGIRDVFGADFNQRVIRTVSHEVTDATVDSQVVTLKDSGADCLVSATTPKFAAQLIRRAYDIGWKPLHCMANVSASVSSVMKPAGAEKGIGIVSSAYIKDPNDPKWANDPAMIEWRAFVTKYGGGLLDVNDVNAFVGLGYVKTLVHVLQQCGDDLSRENIIRQATNIQKLDVGVLFPGITINTSPTNYHPIRQMQLTRWTGEYWDAFGNIIEGA